MQPFDSLLSKRDCIKLKGFFHQLKQLADRSYFAIIAVDSKPLSASFTETIRQNSAIRSEWTEISHSEQLAEIMHDKSGNTCLKVLDLTAIGTQAADRARLNLHFNRDYIIDYNLKIVLLCSFDFFTQILNHAYDLASIAHFSGFFSDREQVVTKDTKKAETTPEYETYLADLSNLIDYQKQENADEEIIMRKSLSAGLSASTVSELSEALNLWSSGLKIALKKNDLQFQTYFLGNIGVIHSNQGNLDQALTYQKQALEIDQQIGYKQGEANQLGNIGNIYSAQGDLDQALTYLKTSP
jgi:tetratricopeptide (TPR) repeat protein